MSRRLLTGNAAAAWGARLARADYVPAFPITPQTEIIETLAEHSKKRLKMLGYNNVTVLHGDGYRGWKQRAPYDVIVVAAAPDHVPQPLVDQLAPGGRMVIPVGRFYQDLVLIEKLDDNTTRHQKVTGVAFVPMTGEAQAGKKQSGEQ